ncbi:hypothetical protein Dimus_018651, partial [Dionaea muscipula]
MEINFLGSFKSSVSRSIKGKRWASSCIKRVVSSIVKKHRASGARAWTIASHGEPIFVINSL